MIKKISFSVVLLAVLLFMNTSCEKWLDVNKNVDAPAQVEGYLYLAGILQAYNGMYYDVRATGGLTQMLGTTSYTQFANHYYYEASDAGGEMWRFTYWLQGMNLENMINQSVAKEDWTLAGIGYAIKAFSWDQMTKHHGDLILKDAFVPGLLAHRYDYQDTIYPYIRKWAYKAIEYLSMTDNHSYGTTISANDYIYGGNKAKWIKFAYGVIVRNLASLSNKTDFVTNYAPELVIAAGKSLATFDDDATLKIGGGGASAAQSAYNNFWGTYRVNLNYVYFQHEYAVQVFTGTVPQYDEATGNKVPIAGNTYYPYVLASPQIICDTIITVPGHYDPRVAVKLSTIDDANYDNLANAYKIKKRKYYGGSFGGAAGPIGTAPSVYGRNSSSAYTSTNNAAHDGKGRWLFRDDAPYILMTCAEIKFCLAEALWKLGQKPEAFQAFKDGVRADLDFTGNYISTGTPGVIEGGIITTKGVTGGDKITKAVYSTIANEYAAGPYVNGLALADFSLSHIMMQKWIALYPWGAEEAWVDMRKYHYDLAYTGDYPSKGNGWTISSVAQKWDSNPTKVYKGLYLPSADVSNRRAAFNTYNDGSPCYRIRPRYNSEYMWNKPSLSTLLPVSGTAVNYQCSIPWFAYPGNYPTTK
jgi:hypothetical protein